MRKKNLNYQSEITQFIAELKRKNPQLEQSQQEGRALLWDKAPINLDDALHDKDAAVAPSPYAYQTLPTPSALPTSPKK